MLVERRYDRDRALAYAREWAMSRNLYWIANGMIMAVNRLI